MDNHKSTGWAASMRRDFPRFFSPRRFGTISGWSPAFGRWAPV